MKTKKQISGFWGIGVLVSAIMVTFAACGELPNSADSDDIEKIISLPSYQGAFVASQSEATTMANDVDIEVQAAIQEVLTQANTSGHYEKNGMVVDYTVTYSGSHGSSHITQITNIEGIYNGYVIQGVYNLIIDRIHTSPMEDFSIHTEYNSWYSVSHNGKGMKAKINGKKTISPSGSSYDLHYAIYDNNNVLRYKYDYKI